MFDKLSGPLSNDYCLLFYISTMLSFVVVLFSIIGFIGIIISSLSGKTKISGSEIFNSLIGVLSIGMIYIQNRLLYNICIKTMT